MIVRKFSAAIYNGHQTGAIENSETITKAAIKLDIQRTYLSRLSGGYKETENVKLLTID